MKLIVEPSTKSNLYENTVDGLILSLKDYSVGSIVSFSLDEIKKIVKDTNIENIPKEPYTLPEGFEWKDINLNQTNDVDKLYIEETKKLAQMLCEHNCTLMFGSSEDGMMGTIYKVFKENTNIGIYFVTVCRNTNSTIS